MSEPARAEINYAGFWRRLVAIVLDSLLYISLSLPVLLAFYGMEYITWLRDSGGVGVMGSFDFLIQYLLPIVLIVVFLLKRGATPGKMLMDCVVVDAKTFQPVTLKQSIVRTLGYIFSILPLYLPFLWIAFDKRKQGLHDKLAGTVVLLRAEDYSDISLDSLKQVL